MEQGIDDKTAFMFLNIILFPQLLHHLYDLDKKVTTDEIINQKKCQ